MNTAEVQGRFRIAWHIPNGNDDTSDTAESRLHVQQVLVIVLIMCSCGCIGQRNQIVTRKLLRWKSHRDNDVVKASLSQEVLPTRPFSHPCAGQYVSDLLRHGPFPEPNASYPSSVSMISYIIVKSSRVLTG